MATAQVRRLHQETHRKVMVMGRDGRPRWHEVFRNNPRIVNELGSARLVNGPGVRPYIASKTLTHWTWQRWDIEPGEIYLSHDERAFGTPYAGLILIEPHTKRQKNGSNNKAWPFERWQKVVDAFPGRRFVQVGPAGTRWLANVARAPTETFRQACAVLAGSLAFVGCEGGLHHAAAALNVPAVTLWSEFIAPEFTGYETQRNIRHADGWCGARVACMGCAESMRRIEVEEVVENLRGSL